MKKSCSFFALFAVLACLTISLAAQDVTVMPPASFDYPDITDLPDTPPTPSNKWSPVFPKEMRATTDTGYAIALLSLPDKDPREKGKGPPLSVVASNKYFGDSVRDASSKLRCTPAQKNGKPVKSWSWIGVIYNPASASEQNASATPRVLKVAPIFATLEQLDAFPDTDGPCRVRGSIEIDTAGAAKNLKLETNAPYAQAVRPAIERSLAKWQFAPARKDDQPVSAALTLDFVLQGPPPIVSGVTSFPNVIKQTDPVYPEIMKSSNMVGNVVVNFTVDTNGNVRSASVVRSNNPNFEQPAIDAILQWKFKPAMKDGRLVNVRMQIPISFNLAYDDGDAIDNLKTAYSTSQPTKKQIAKMPEGLRYDVAPKPVGVIYPVYPYEMLRDGKKGEATVAALVIAPRDEQPNGKNPSVKRPGDEPPGDTDPESAIRKIFPDASNAEIKELLAKTSVVVIEDSGHASQLSLVKQTAPEFGYAALAACEYFEFTPGQLKGKPTDAILTIKQTFNSDSLFVTDEDRAMLRLEKKSPQKIIGASKLDAAPKLIVTRRPPFPLMAQQAGLTKGSTTVEFLIDTEGKVRLPRIVSSTHPSFGYIAVQTVANWRYEPPKAQGKPVVTRARISFEFSTKDTAPSGE